MFDAVEYDKDLNPVLEAATDMQLDPIVKTLLETNTEDLSSNPLYKINQPQHSKYAALIAKELRAFGGHTAMNIARQGWGPEYAEIVRDVADVLKVEYTTDLSVPKLERLILIKVISRIYENLDATQQAKLRQDFNQCSVDLEQLLRELNIKDADLDKIAPSVYILAATVVTATLVRLAALGALGGLTAGAVASFGLGRLVGVLAGPIGWGATILYGIFEVGKPALRVTIPCVLQVALIRIFQEADPDHQKYMEFMQKHALSNDNEVKFVSFEQYLEQQHYLEDKTNQNASQDADEPNELDRANMLDKRGGSAVSRDSEDFLITRFRR